MSDGTAGVFAAEPPVDVAALWRVLRVPVAIGLIAVALVAALAVIGASPNDKPLDPRNASPDGARALSVLLAERGVGVHVTTSVGQIHPTASTTILISTPADLSVRSLHAVLGSAATVVLIDPPPRVLAASGVPAVASGRARAETLAPQCAVTPAVVAGPVRVTGTLYDVTSAATRCYREGSRAALVTVTRASGGQTIVFGSGSTLTNSELGVQGDAALAIGLLDSPVLRWVPAGLDDGPVPSSQRGLINLLPNRLVAALVQLAIFLIVLALWRARRLGRPVAEPLPVVVRAAETVEGTARLLRATRSRGSAAQSLRNATTRRLAHALRLGADEDPAAVVAVVAAASHTPTEQVAAVLYGGDPADDTALVTLAKALPDLEAAVRGEQRPGGPS